MPYDAPTRTDEMDSIDHFESHDEEPKPIDLMMKEASELHEYAEQVAQEAMERVVQIVGPRGELSEPVEKEGPRTQFDSILSACSLITELRETYLKGINNALTKIQMAINSL